MSADLADARLAEQEAIIERGLVSFLAVGNALMTIRTDRLYLLTHESFSAYCLDRWGFSDSRARQLTLAAKAVTAVTAAGLVPPENEAQARELAKVAEPDREQVWRETLDRTGGKPTAVAVREVAAAPAGVSEHPSSDPTTDRAEAERTQHRDAIRTARRAAGRIVSALRLDTVAIVAGIELGEPDLVTTEMVEELRATLAVLERQLAERTDLTETSVASR